ncbi:major facilitator superfamily domain-containing protein [Plectosphaerella plurivora]|uniref:Major facilitator superfamily domain-containing protein n=1 Tax=Plectosphaerella plurivora TaxID=936078 RepID=A0A9P8V5U1_9PEZI|nr:major facilitator superfamily domain-containing protein [Plectosphaerella plurivora]
MDSPSAEKEVHSTVKDGSGSGDEFVSQIEWSEDEEKKLVKKLDLIILPLLTLGFYALQLDRGNIGNALTDFFLRDVGITQNQFNTGQQLLSAGIIILEIPSNLILYRIGPAAWLGGQMVAWGLIATFQTFQKGLAAYLATRFLLGLGEAGFIPGSLFTITRWYKREETSKRFSVFFLGNMLASATSGLIAFGILRMRGIAGLAGWQWLFIIEGIFTVLIGIFFLAVFPKSTSNPTSLFGARYFTERERLILTERIIRDDPSKAQPRQRISWKELRETLSNWRLLPHVGLTICGIAPSSAFGSYAPSLVVGMGYGRLESNALVSIAYWILLFSILLWGWASDRMRIRGLWVLLGMVIFWAFNLGNLSLAGSSNGAVRFAILTLTIAISWPWHPVNGSWVSLNAKTASERSISMAVHIMAANSGGIVGKQIFREEDAPVYRQGWRLVVILTSIAVFCSLLANLQYYFGNGRKLARSGLRYAY